MSVPEAEITKGDVSSPGGAEQLPQGAAQSTNQGFSNVATSEQIRVEFDDPSRDGTEGFRMSGEEDEVLFADPDNPAPISRPADLRKQPKKPLPSEVVRQLPMLRQMAMDPRAPRALKLTYKALLHRLEIETGL